MALIQCSKCNALISDLAKSCPHCGAPGESPCKCMECGHIVSSNAISCPQCGAPLKSEWAQNRQYKNPYAGNDFYQYPSNRQMKHAGCDTQNSYAQDDSSYSPHSDHWTLDYPRVTYREAVSACFSKYATFSGRARRSEYWFWWLFNILISISICCFLGVFLADDNEGAIGVLVIISILYSLVVFLPGLAVLVRRLHDIGKRGSNVFWLLLPIVGWIMMFAWLLRDSDSFENEYGPSPKYQCDSISYSSILDSQKKSNNYISTGPKKQNEYKTATNGKIKDETSFCEPQPQPTLGEAISICFRKYANFSGRARRSEYWFWSLFQTIITSSCTIFLSILSICLATKDVGVVSVGSNVLLLQLLYGIWVLTTAIPSLAVLVRRFHDIGKSGWNILWCFLPIIGGIIILVYAVTDSDPDTNRYGISPKYSCAQEY